MELFFQMKRVLSWVLFFKHFYYKGILEDR